MKRIKIIIIIIVFRTSLFGSSGSADDRWPTCGGCDILYGNFRLSDDISLYRTLTAGCMLDC